MPKIASVHTVSITAWAASAMSVTAPGTRHDGLSLLLDIDKADTAAASGVPRVTGRPTSLDAPATISIYCAIDRLAGGEGISAAEAIARRAAENKRLSTLVEKCRAERDIDPRFVAFPVRLPYGSLDQIIVNIERAGMPRPAAADNLLREARNVQGGRDARDTADARWLKVIIEKSRAGELQLWGDKSNAAHAETEKLSPNFLLRNVTLDSSLHHLALAQSRDNPTAQRAIIAPDGPRSSAYYNVRILQAEFEHVFKAQLKAVKPAADHSEAEQEIRTWYVEHHVPHYEARGEIPSREQSEADAHVRFGDVRDFRDIMRRCRKTLAPEAWRGRGRRRSQKLAKK